MTTSDGAEPKDDGARVYSPPKEEQAAAEPPANEQAAPAPAPEQNTAQVAGRGGMAIAVAKISFVLFGLIQQIALPRVLDEAGYGSVSRMLAVVSILNNVVVAMSIQGVSRTVAGAKPGEEDFAFRRVLTMHTVLALGVSTTFAALTGVIANALEAPHAATPLRVAAVVVLCYGVYAPLVGALNGKRRFLDQAGLDIFYGASRMVLMTGGALIFSGFLGGDGSLGAAVGFAAAAMLIVPIALSRSGFGKSGGPAGVVTLGGYASFLGPLIVGQVGLNLLLQVDMLLLSDAAGEAARAQGLDVKEADKLLGPYRATQLFGFLPYQLLMAVQFVLFPLLAKAHAEKDAASVRAFTQQGVRLALILMGLIGGTAAALAPHLLRLVFPANIAEDAAPFSRLYVLGMASLAIFGVACAALTSLKKELYAMALTLGTVGLIVAGIVAFRTREFGAPLLMSTAYATAGAVASGALVASLVLRGVAGGLVSVLTVVRVGLAIGLLFAAGSFLPTVGKVVVIGLAAVFAVAYLVILIVTGELGKADVATLKRVIGRKKA